MGFKVQIRESEAIPTLRKRLRLLQPEFDLQMILRELPSNNIVNNQFKY